MYVDTVSNYSKEELWPTIRVQIQESSGIHPDGWAMLGWFLIVVITMAMQHPEDKFVRSRIHIDGCTSFWGFAKKRLQVNPII